MNTKTEIIPTITVKTWHDFKQKAFHINDCFKTAQFDIVDRNFADNQTFSLIKKAGQLHDHLKYDLHLMSKNPEKYIPDGVYAKKIRSIIIPYETNSNIEMNISLIKKGGKKVGIAINPETNPEKIRSYIDKVDMILVLCVNPGFYGSPFISKSINKIKKIRKLNDEIIIAADGGIKNNNIKEIKEAGANIFYVGSFLFEGEIDEQRQKLLKALEPAEKKIKNNEKAFK
jgi:ribulose-phosphate 3-epimerase